MIDISIIIPHKNSAELLTRCLESIPVSDNKEIIIVDDNSDKYALDFDHFPGKKRRDTKIIYTKEGKGAGYARNVGMSIASGEWVIFADADDYFATDAFDVFDKYTKTDNDLIFFGVRSVMSKNLMIPSRRTDYYQKLMNEPDINMIRYKSNVPWGKMIRRKVIASNDLKFDETMVANDAYFSCMLSIKAQKVERDLHIVYYCTEGNSTLKMRHQSKSDRITRYKATIKCDRLLKAHHLQMYNNYPSTWLFKSSKIKDWLPLPYLIQYLIFFKKKALTDAYWFLKYH